MNMLRHQHISRHHKSVPQPYRFKLSFEDLVRASLAQKRQSSVTTEGDEVEDAALLVTNKTLRHSRGI
jgi:hypothetical protein